VVNRRTEDTLRRSGFVLERFTHTRMGLLPVIVGIAQPEPLASDGGSVYPGGDA